MKVYTLMEPDELAEAWRKRRQRDLFDMGDTLGKIREFFASGDLIQGRLSGERTGGVRGTGVERGAGCQGEGNGPVTERGNDETVHVQRR